MPSLWPLDQPAKDTEEQPPQAQRQALPALLLLLVRLVPVQLGLVRLGLVQLGLVRLGPLQLEVRWPHRPAARRFEPAKNKKVSPQ